MLRVDRARTPLIYVCVCLHTYTVQVTTAYHDGDTVRLLANEREASLAERYPVAADSTPSGDWIHRSRSELSETDEPSFFPCDPGHARPRVSRDVAQLSPSATRTSPSRARILFSSTLQPGSPEALCLERSGGICRRQLPRRDGKKA